MRTVSPGNSPKKAPNIGMLDSFSAISRKISNYLLNRKAFHVIKTKINGIDKLIILGGMPNNLALFEKELKELSQLMVPSDEEISRAGVVDLRTSQECQRWPQDSRFSTLDTHHMPIIDHDSFEGNFDEVEKALNFIDNKAIIYVNCKSGIGRSFSLVLVYFMTRENSSVQSAYADIKNERPQVAPNTSQLLKACEFVYALEEKKYLAQKESHSSKSYSSNSNHELPEQPKVRNPEKLISTFSDFCWASHHHYQSILRKRDIEKINLLPDELAILIRKALFILEKLRSENGFTIKDAEKFHNNLSTIFRMLVGTSITYSNVVYSEPSKKTPKHLDPNKGAAQSMRLPETLNTLNADLQDAIKNNALLKKGEARSVCTALLEATKKSQSEFKNHYEKLPAGSSDRACIQKWHDSLNKHLKTLNDLQNSDEIELEALKKIQTSILDDVSIETNVIVLSTLEAKSRDELEALSITDPNKRKPILIQHCGKISIYGKASKDKEWDITELNSAIFETIPFSEQKELKNYNITDKAMLEIKKGHDPESSGCYLFELLRRFAASIKNFLHIGQKKNDLYIECMQSIKHADKNSFTCISTNKLSFFGSTRKNTAQTSSESDICSSATDGATTTDSEQGSLSLIQKF